MNSKNHPCFSAFPSSSESPRFLLAAPAPSSFPPRPCRNYASEQRPPYVSLYPLLLHHLTLSAGPCSCRRPHPSLADFTCATFGDVPVAPSTILHYTSSSSGTDIAQLGLPPSSFATSCKLSYLLPFSTTLQLRALASVHRISVPRDKTSREDLCKSLSSHVCNAACDELLSIFTFASLPDRPRTYRPRVVDSVDNTSAPSPPPPPPHPVPTPSTDNAVQPLISASSLPSSSPSSFPPAVLSVAEKATFVSDWCSRTSADAVYESACSVCARLTLQSTLTSFPETGIDLTPLHRDGLGITRAERFNALDPVRELSGPILYSPGVTVSSDGSRSLAVCAPCVRALQKHTMPRHSLANGRWVGDQPACLVGLSYVEQLIIARYRHSFCVAQVARSGQRFLATNVIIFGQPVDRMYSALPPPRQDIEQCLAILFVGAAKPTDEDVRRTPFLVRHSNVLRALNWLQLNNPHYSDITISLENLATYPEDSPPVCVIHRPHSSTAGPENLAVYESGNERSVTDGESSFVVHTLHAHDLARMTYDAKVAAAIRHFEDGHAALAYGHDPAPQSIYHNCDLFPRMFPWLYPYGLGGFENAGITVRLDRTVHIRDLLLMPDRRFQNDRCFPFIVFNHEQIRASSQGGFLLTSRKNFSSVAERILQLDREALSAIIERGASGDYVRPETPAEKQCFELMTFVDHIAGHVKGSNTSRKYQRNEIKSLIFAKGAPVWFITFAPADFKNPLCLYYCGEQIDLSDRLPTLRNSNDRLRAIAHNPVGAARFFDKVVHLFVECILRIDDTRPGLFGPTEAYYGTVEAQGRLSLHLHTLLWITGSPSPQIIRERLLSDGEFESQLLGWMDDCMTGDFIATPGVDLSSRLEEEYIKTLPSGEKRIARRLRGAIRDPATTLPICPPPSADDAALQAWYKSFVHDTDELVFCSNSHDPSHLKGCWRTKGSYCRARFPRPLVSTTDIDRESGAIRFSKSERWLNTYNPTFSSVIRSNSDVTCILSGTQVKAILAYITDYITKSSLTTHAFFEIVKSVLDRNTELLHDASADRERSARSLLVKIVNAMTAASEIGGPAVCAYLLGNPDHYTSAQFKVFYWYSFLVTVRLTLPACDSSAAPQSPQTPALPPPVPALPAADASAAHDSEPVMLALEHDSVVAVNKVNDYVHRPTFFEQYSLYDFCASTDMRKLRDKECFRSSSQDPPATSKATAYQFLPQHPLFLTHGVYVRPPSQQYVLNFVGRSLPRVDKGDREEYATVMLMLFKPGGWRRGSDLLHGFPTCSSAFESTSFSSAHRDVMLNMNIMFECLDARDDYSAQRRAGMSSDEISPSTLR